MKILKRLKTIFSGSSNGSPRSEEKKTASKECDATTCIRRIKDRITAKIDARETVRISQEPDNLDETIQTSEGLFEQLPQEVINEAEEDELFTVAKKAVSNNKKKVMGVQERLRRSCEQGEQLSKQAEALRQHIKGMGLI